MKKARSLDGPIHVDAIDIVGADANNLRNVDVRIPLRRVVAVTGVSGSGKSSLLGDTLAVEANRRMRTFLGIQRPDDDAPPPGAFIGAMPPAIHVGQHAFRASSRTTIATATGLLATLRRLFITCARPYSDDLRRFISAPSAATYAAWLQRHYRGHAIVTAVPVFRKATDGIRCVERLRKLGIEEVTIRSETDWDRARAVRLARFKPLSPALKHIVEVSIVALDVHPKVDGIELEALLQHAFKAGEGHVFVDLPEATRPELRGPFGPRLDSMRHQVDEGLATCFFAPNAHLLSFNVPEHLESGACPTCQGIGRATDLDESTLIAHPDRSMRDGAIALWTPKNYRYINIQHETIEGLAGVRGFSPDTPWNKLSVEARRLIIDGAGDELITDRDPKTGRKLSAPRRFEGFRSAILERVGRPTKVSNSLAFLVRSGACSDCGGTRWSTQARALRVAGLGIHNLLAKPFVDLAPFTRADGSFAQSVTEEGRSLVRLVNQQAEAFVSVGLGHLTGDRGMSEISEGESRRTSLAAVLHADHAGLCLLLDEPARGLHEEDMQGLARVVRRLSSEHTVVMNEHRDTLVRMADHVVELGPGAGSAGGNVVYEGPVSSSSWAKNGHVAHAARSKGRETRFLTIRGATIHNVQDATCAIPLGRLTCITGVSGSGKSSLVRGVLVPAIAVALPSSAELQDFDRRVGSWKTIEGIESIRGLVALGQKSPPPNRRSLVVTFLNIADHVRAAFGASRDARRVGLSSSDFGLNAGNGRCQLCLGLGEIADQSEWSTCPACGGTRFGEEALSVSVDGMSISELLDTPVADLHVRAPAIVAPYLPILAAMVDLGVGHIALGRRLDTLSGGEIQRTRIAAKLAEHHSGGQVFVLDEPAAGLHPEDVERLVRAVIRILNGGSNTVVLVEHNLSVLRAADWLIELGPGSGPHGGRIIASGPPAEVQKADTPTGRALAGQSPAAPVHPPRVEPILARRAEAPRDPVLQSGRIKAWIRKLLGDDTAPPDEPLDRMVPDRPIAVLGESFWHGRRAHEIGDLDLELARLLLDREWEEAGADRIEELAQIWEKGGDLRVAIHPFLRDLQIWGPHLPRSAVATTRKHLRAMGLSLLDAGGKTLEKRDDFDCLAARATGDRFVPRRGEHGARRQILMDALALGGGYVELQRPTGEVIGYLRTRLLDLATGIVGPLAANPLHFSRHHRQGQCPMCRGVGTVMAFAEDLLIGARGAKPEEERFLHPAAAELLRGVRRTELAPFLRRLGEEGLWDRAATFDELDEGARDMLLFGCWTRPGPGTFLKSARKDPGEVNAWLRWNGLYREALGQLQRSTRKGWKEAVERSHSRSTCPLCDGTGLAAQSALLRLGGRSLRDWARDGTAGELHEALTRLRTSTPRQRRTKDRLIDCLSPLAGQAWSAPLREPASDELAREITRRVVSAFTDMPLILAGR